jgi:hypothetical protein
LAEFDFTEISPSSIATPASGVLALFANNTTKRFNYKDDTGKTGQISGVNSWYDVTDYGLIGDGSTDNTAAFNTLYASLPIGATVFFPGAISGYNFASELTLNRDIRVRFLGTGKGSSLLRTTSATANLFNQTVAGFYIVFQDLGFVSSATKTAGAFINIGNNNAYLNILGCEFQNYFQAVSYQNATAGNLGLIEDCQFDTPAVNGTSITINGSNINIVIADTTINNTGVAGTTGLLINQSGAVQVIGCDFIGGVNAMLVNATATVSAVLICNTFFDQSTLGSTVKFMGTSAITRIKFVECGITCGVVGGSGVTACEIAGTGTGTSIPEAIDFIGCDFYNNGGSGTTNGILATGVRNFKVIGCRISGFTNGINVTPYNANGITSFDIIGNTIGVTENFAANGTGILLNAGSFAYGSFQITNNNFANNTTAQITDNSTFAATTAAIYNKVINNNIGIIATPSIANYTATTIPLTTVTNVDSHGGMFIPTGIRPCSIRITVYATNAATLQTLTATLRYGVNNSNADTAILTQAFTAGTAAVGSGTFVFDIDILTTTTLGANMKFFNGNNAATGIAGNISLFSGVSNPATIVTNVNNWIGVYFSSATASAITIRSVKYEVQQQ